MALSLATALVLVAGVSVRADLVLQLTFDDDNDPGLDSSGNDYDGEVEGALWVDDDEREGVLEFSGGDDGFVRVRDLEELPGDGFTITCWAYRDPFTAANNAGLFQIQFGGDVPTTTPADKTIGGWVATSAGVWGRLHQQDRTTINLDSATFLMEDETWTHLAYRADGEIFEVIVDGEAGIGPAITYDGTLDLHDTLFVGKQAGASWGADGEIFEVIVDGEPGIGPAITYDGTLDLHDTLFVGKQAGASWGGRIDDFRVYNRALTDDEIELVMDGEDLFPDEPAFLRGDADASGSLQITDAISALNYLFAGTFTPTCLDALDWNDNGSVELTDPIGVLNRQFAGGDPAPAPGSEDCGPDPTADELACESFAACL